MQRKPHSDALGPPPSEGASVYASTIGCASDEFIVEAAVHPQPALVRFQLVIAEHGCADYAFVSERETCMRLFLAASQVGSSASR
jgi:hypothetical protein